MSYKKSLALPVLASCIVISGSFTAKADPVETTTVRTTTTSSTVETPAVVETTAFVLPSGNTYAVVDPITGIVQGVYDPTAKLFNGKPLAAGVLLVDKGNGKLIALVDTTGNIVDINTVNATEGLMASIDARRNDLDRVITEALHKGDITGVQSAALRSQLDRITTQEAVSKEHNALSYNEAIVLAYNLDLLADNIVTVLQASGMPPVIPLIPPQLVAVNGQISLVDSITARKMELQRRVDGAYQAGRLSGQNVAKLKEQLNQISLFETRYRDHGMISDSKAKILSMKLDQVQSSLDNDVTHINKKRSEIGIIVE